MRLPLQLFALGAFVAMWIAFTHRGRAPTDAFTLDSIAAPLALLFCCAVGLAWSYRQPLRAALERAADETHSWTDERATRITVGLLVCAGFFLRLAGTSETGLNPDEAQLAWVSAASTLQEMWLFEVKASPHPPAIFLLMHYMLNLSWDPGWLRLPSVLCGAFSIWMSYRVARELLGAPAGVVVAWLVMFSPPLFELSRVARNYSPGFAFILLALFLFVRFLKTDRWRYFSAYTVAATIAVTWHYVFVVAFIALKVVLAIELLRRRAPLRSWFTAGAIQLPLAAVLLWLYVNHIAILPAPIETMHMRMYQLMLGFDPWAPLASISWLWYLLAPGWVGTVLIALSIAGVVVLAAARRWLTLSLCLVPLLLATGLAWAGKIPLGFSRHSVYLFPFLFLLVASNASEILTGYRATRSNLARLGRGLRWLEPTASSSLSAAAWGTAAACALAASFAAGSLLDYNDEHERNPFTAGGSRNPFLSRSYHGFELVRSFRQADVERAFELLEQRAGPNDWVMLDMQSLFTLRHYLKAPPVIVGRAFGRTRDDIACVVAGSHPLQRNHNGVQYYFSNKIAYKAPLKQVMTQLADVRRVYSLDWPRKVWLIRSAWVPSLLDLSIPSAKQVLFDRYAFEETDGLLLGVDTHQLIRFARRSKGRGEPSRRPPAAARREDAT